MNDLIARLEALAGPNYAMDCSIAAAMGWPDTHLAKPFTASIDAAMTLVPEGWRVYAIQNEQYPPSPARWFAGLDHIPHTESMIGKSPHAAIAICIASLKARAASGKRDARSAGQQK